MKPIEAQITAAMIGGIAHDLLLPERCAEWSEVTEQRIANRLNELLFANRGEAKADAQATFDALKKYREPHAPDMRTVDSEGFIESAPQAGEDDATRADNWLADHFPFHAGKSPAKNSLVAFIAAVRADERNRARREAMEAFLPHAGLILNRDEDQWECFCGESLGALVFTYEKRRELMSLDSELSWARVKHREHIRALAANPQDTEPQATTSKE